MTCLNSIGPSATRWHWGSCSVWASFSTSSSESRSGCEISACESAAEVAVLRRVQLQPIGSIDNRIAVARDAHATEASADDEIDGEVHILCRDAHDPAQRDVCRDHVSGQYCPDAPIEVAFPRLPRDEDIVGNHTSETRQSDSDRDAVGVDVG